MKHNDDGEYLLGSILARTFPGTFHGCADTWIVSN